MAHTIIGVMPPGFGFPTLDAQVYVPMGELGGGLPWDDRQSSFGARAIARLSPGMTVEAAQRDMDRVTREVDEVEGRPGSTAVVAPLAESYRGEARGPALVLMGAVVFVLLIAGVNVANLLLARGEDRRREVAVRSALGAGRGAITRQLLTESLLLATGGALVGLLVAAGGLALIRAYVPLPPLLGEAVRIDGRVLGFTAGLVVVVGLVFGALPALRVSASGPVLALREAGRGVAGPGRHRLRAVLVIAEVGLALVLLVASGLMIASLSKLRHVESGFESGEMLTAMVPASTAGGASKEQWRGFYDRLLERVNGEPGVTSAAATLLIPLAPRSWELRVQPEGVPYDPLEGASVLYNIVSAGYFETFGVPLVRGRDFTPSDRDDSAPVVIIDETLAAQYWPGEDPLGKRVAFEELSEEEAGGAGPVPVYRTVVGVVPNLRHYELRNASRIQVYVPLHQTLRRWGSTLFVAVRTTGDAASFAPRLRQIVREMDPQVPVSRLRTFETYIAEDLATERALSGLLAALGALALGLSAIGVFGVMSLIVAARKREIGVRLAIGARPVQVSVMILGRTLALAAAGAAIGLPAAAALARVMRAFLFEMSPFDARVYGGAAAFLLAVAALAALIPALRAASVDPMTTLRQEG
jgi:putative ABC transport system permease protein